MASHTDTPRDAWDQLNAGMSAMSGILLSDEALDAVLELVVKVAPRAIGRTDAASVSFKGDERMETLRASTVTAVEADEAQYTARSGPCVEAMETGERRNAIIRDHPEWAAFAAASIDRGFESILSMPLTVRGSTVGALNLYSNQRAAYPDDDVQAAALFAQQTSIVLANAATLATSATLNQQLQEALLSRDVIGMAKGILVAREGMSPDKAFDALRRLSQHTNRKLREIAVEVVESATNHTPERRP